MLLLDTLGIRIPYVAFFLANKISTMDREGEEGILSLFLKKKYCTV